MATVQSDSVASNAGFAPHPKGTGGVRKVTMPVTAAQLALNNVLEIVPIYNGDVVLKIWARSTDIDTNGAPAVVLDFGDRDTVDGFIDGSVIGQAGGDDETDANTFPVAYTADNAICAKVVTAPATAADGTITVYALIA